MSSFLCFICHSTVNAETSEEIREKYREIVGMNLCLDSQLCHICCHVLNKLSLFRSVCLKRSLEYPVLFSEKGTINLQKSNIEVLAIPCSDNSCNLYQSSTKSFHFTYDLDNDYGPNNNYNAENQNQYVALEDDNKFKGYFTPDYQFKAEDVEEFTAEDVEENNVNYEVNNTGSIETSQVDDCVTNDKLSCKYEFKYRNEETNVDYDKENNDNYYRNGIDGNIDEINQNDNNFDTEDPNDINNQYADGIDEDNDEINQSDNIFYTQDINDVNNESETETKELELRKKRKKKVSKKLMLSVEEQKAVLEARRREKKYLDAEFKCYNCALSFLFKDTYQTHMMRHEESNGEYLCPICALRFASPAGLRSHALVHARRALPAPRPAQKATCHLCGHLLKDANGLRQHLRRVHVSRGSRLHSCTVCGDTFPSQPKLRTHMIKHIGRKFPCPECPAVCSSPYTLAQHCRRHGAPPEQHRCAACGKRYGSRKALLAHRRHGHEQSALECPMCSRLCPNQRSLSMHVQAIHSNTKDHECPHCPARYSTRRSLLRHIASHTQKPQPAIATCHLCGNCFKGKSKLNRHLKNVCEKDKLELEEQLTSLY